MNFGTFMIVLFTIAALATVSAQHAPLPKTVKLHNNATKEPIGTATFSDNRIYFRDKNDKHFATVVIAPDGKRTAYDPSGNVIDGKITLPAVSAPPAD